MADLARLYRAHLAPAETDGEEAGAQMNKGDQNSDRNGTIDGIVLILLVFAVLAKWITGRKVRELDGLGVVYKG